MIIEEITSIEGLTYTTFSSRLWFYGSGWSDSGGNVGASGSFTSGSVPDVSCVFGHGYDAGNSILKETIRSRFLFDFDFSIGGFFNFTKSFSFDVEYGSVDDVFSSSETSFSNVTKTAYKTNTIIGDGASAFGGGSYDYYDVSEVKKSAQYGYYVTLKNISLTSGSSSNNLKIVLDEVSSSSLIRNTCCFI